MATKSKATFQKRMKEMKRQEKQRMKAERRAQKKLANQAEREAATNNPTPTEPAESAEPQLQS
ncbi:MAG: hypothetical protein ACHQLQ_09810 [Candidatus Acidiferrales bacterium]